MGIRRIRQWIMDAATLSILAPSPTVNVTLGLLAEGRAVAFVAEPKLLEGVGAVGCVVFFRLPPKGVVILIPLPLVILEPVDTDLAPR